MPCIDLPLESLKTYTGTNPKPAGFDDYWIRALKELDGVDPQPVLKKSEAIHRKMQRCLICGSPELVGRGFMQSISALVISQNLVPLCWNFMATQETAVLGQTSLLLSPRGSPLLPWIVADKEEKVRMPAE
jgi:hypothetical protein